MLGRFMLSASDKFEREVPSNPCVQNNSSARSEASSKSNFFGRPRDFLSFVTVGLCVEFCLEFGNFYYGIV